MKKIFLSAILSTILFGATAEQVEQYLSVSNSEEQLIALEAGFSSMQNALNQKSEESKNYDMQMLSVRFKEKLASELSEDEMKEVLENYNSMVYLQFASATAEQEQTDPQTLDAYIQKLKSDETAHDRLLLIEEIGKHIYKKEYLSEYFDALIAPLYGKSSKDQKAYSDFLKQTKKGYMEMMQTEGQRQLIYALRDFSQEELEELLKVVKRPSVDHETKAVYKAMAYALQEYFKSLASRFDPSKHQLQAPDETNTSL
jgi:hypothetical protein